MNKKELRQRYLQQRRDLLPEELNLLTEGIVKTFATLSFSNIQLVHLFYPIIGKLEFNSLLLKEYLQAKYPAIQFVLPKSNIEDHTLANILWNEDTPLALNQWGITEPEYGEVVPARKIDMVVVPLLAFDKQGNRIGYGKGFYDRFLADCRVDVYKIGMSYFGPEDSFEEVDPFDIPLNVCVTPDKIWKFSK